MKGFKDFNNKLNLEKHKINKRNCNKYVIVLKCNFF